MTETRRAYFARLWRTRRVCGFGILLDEGAEWPPFYGKAWRDWATFRAVCFPGPLNLLLGACHDLWFMPKNGTVGRKGATRYSLGEVLPRGLQRIGWVPKDEVDVLRDELRRRKPPLGRWEG